MAKFWARMGGVAVTEQMIELETKVGLGRDLIEAIARRKTAAAMAWEQGLTVSETEVEAALGRFYEERGLRNAEACRAWRDQLRVKEDILRSYLREEILIRQLRRKIAPDDSVAARFAARARDFRQVEFELHTFTSEHAAREFIAAVEEGEIAPRLGDHQRLPSSMLPRQIAEDIAAARPGDLLGPIETRANSHQVYRLLRWHEPQLDERLREHIREELFHEALDPILQKEALVFLV